MRHRAAGKGLTASAEDLDPRRTLTTLTVEVYWADKRKLIAAMIMTLGHSA